MQEGCLLHRRPEKHESNFVNPMHHPFAKSSLLLFCFAAILSAFFACGVYADERQQLQVRVGLAGTYKVGCWTEVHVESQGVQARRYQVEVEVLDADGNQVQFQSDAVKAGADGEISVSVPVHVGRIHTRFTTRLFELPQLEQQDGGVPANGSRKLIAQYRVPREQTTELTQFQPLYVAVGRVGEISVTQQFVDQLHVLEIESLSDMPTNILCWQAIDSLIYEAKQDDATDSLEGINRLINWTQSGGHLIVFPGADAEFYMKSTLAQSLPVTYSGVAQVRDFSRLESYVEEPARIRNRAPLTVPRVTEFDGVTVVDSLSGPLITQCPWGLGRVSVVGINFNDKVFQEWQALPQLYRLLAELPEIGEEKSKANSRLLTQAGLTDLKTQWDAALSDFHLQTPSVWVPLGYLLLAALLVGPFDYFLVRHILNRPWLTWFTFPLLVGLLALWGMNGVASRYAPSRSFESSADPGDGKQTDRFRDIISNQALVIDYAADINRERHFGYVKLFSNKTGRYEIDSAVDIPLRGKNENANLFAPVAIPEKTFRGYYRESGIHLDQTAYQVSPYGMKSSSTPIYNRSTLLYEIVGGSETDANKDAERTRNSNDKGSEKDEAAVIEPHLTSSGRNQLKGNLTYHLDTPLSHWILAYGKLIYYVEGDHPLATLEAGETVRLSDSAVRQKEFSVFMTGKTVQAVKRKMGVGEDMLVSREKYDPFSTDLLSILRTITFHETIGGRQYTSLTNVELNSWDFSALLKLNRAILIGQLERPGLETRVDGHVVQSINNSSYLRVVLPVEQEIVNMDRLPDYGNDKQATSRSTSSP